MPPTGSASATRPARSPAQPAPARDRIRLRLPDRPDPTDRRLSSPRGRRLDVERHRADLRGLPAGPTRGVRTQGLRPADASSSRFPPWQGSVRTPGVDVGRAIGDDGPREAARSPGDDPDRTPADDRDQRGPDRLAPRVRARFLPIRAILPVCERSGAARAGTMNGSSLGDFVPHRSRQCQNPRGRSPGGHGSSHASVISFLELARIFEAIDPASRPR